MKTPRNNRTSKALTIVMAAVISLTALIATPRIANADPKGTDCRRYNVGLTNETALKPEMDEPVVYWYTSKLKVPYRSDSNCNDINITNIVVPGDSTHETTCVNFRVRFYPIEGGNSATGWKTFCTGSSWKEAATNVINGTIYRIEARPLSNPNYRPYYTIYD